MRFCPPNVTLEDVWINHGVSECFMETVSMSTIAGFLFLFGTIQIWAYRKYATQISSYTLPHSKLFKLQIFFSCFVPLLCISRFILQTSLFDKGEIYGYMILTVCLTSLVWPLSVAIILYERHYMLPSTPTKGHGLVLLGFWTLVFITENLAFLNLRATDWWFNLNR